LFSLFFATRLTMISDPIELLDTYRNRLDELRGFL